MNNTRRSTKSGLRESAGIGYAIQSIRDPLHGRTTRFDLDYSLGQLAAVEEQIEKIETWAAKKEIDIEARLSASRAACQACRTELENYKESGGLDGAQKQLVRAYDQLWRSIEAH